MSQVTVNEIIRALRNLRKWHDIGQRDEKNFELASRIEQYSIAPPEGYVLVLVERVKALEAKPVGEPVAWMNPDGSLTPYHKLGEEQEPLYTTPPSIDALIAEIKKLYSYSLNSNMVSYKKEQLEAIFEKHKGAK